jgi:predicted HicB family RNase H-like nuclease
MAKRPDKVTLSIPPDLKRRAKVQAAWEGKSLSSIVTELLEKWLAEKEKASADKD